METRAKRAMMPMRDNNKWEINNTYDYILRTYSMSICIIYLSINEHIQSSKTINL
jgi:hypothetical protein